MNYYANPKIPDSLSSSNEKHLRSFFKTGLKIIVILAVFLILLDLATRLLAPLVPFSWERRLAPDNLIKNIIAAENQNSAVAKELDGLVQRLAASMDLPPDMTLTVHYYDIDMVNAVATLGGNIIVFQGLLNHMESEDALAAVLAHEIAHVKHRDMLKGLSRAVGLMIVSAFLTGGDGSSAIHEGALQLGMLSYSRGQETRADTAATLTLGRLYGHSQGFEECFKALINASGDREPPEILSSHPDSRKRIDKSKKVAAQNGFPSRGQTRPISPVFRPAKGPEKNPEPSRQPVEANRGF